MVSEIIRYQTPLPHMRRTTTRDVELNGRKIMRGEKVVLGLSGNYDDAVIERPNDFWIDRPSVRNHLPSVPAYTAVGNRLAEMQLRIFGKKPAAL